MELSLIYLYFKCETNCRHSERTYIVSSRFFIFLRPLNSSRKREREKKKRKKIFNRVFRIFFLSNRTIRKGRSTIYFFLGRNILHDVYERNHIDRLNNKESLIPDNLFLDIHEKSPRFLAMFRLHLDSPSMRNFGDALAREFGRQRRKSRSAFPPFPESRRAFLEARPRGLFASPRDPPRAADSFLDRVGNRRRWEGLGRGGKWRLNLRRFNVVGW